MTVTYTLSDAAVWSDGSPMSAADIECTWQASLNTPEAITTAGYDQIIAVTSRRHRQEVVVDLRHAVRAMEDAVQPILQASQHADCNDVTDDFPGGVYTYGDNPTR